jgi:hypothetical protein
MILIVSSILRSTDRIRAAGRHWLSLTLLVAMGAAEISASAAQVVKTNLPAPSGTRLVVSLGGGGIEVVTHELPEIRLEAERNARGRSPAREEQLLLANPLRIRHQGTNWVINTVPADQEPKLADGERPPLGGVFKLWVPKSCGVDLTTQLGAIAVTGLAADVRAQSAGGALRFTGINGAIVAETASGTIGMTNCIGTNAIVTRGGGIQVVGGEGDLRAESGGGTIIVRRYRGSVNAEVSAGNLQFEQVNGAIQGLTGSGRIVADLLGPVPGAVRLEASGGGGIVVHVPRDAGFELDAKTSAGFVSLGVGKAPAQSAPVSERQESVNGGGPEMWLRTGAGSIRVMPWVEPTSSKTP